MKLLVYSDGLTDIADSHGEILGNDFLLELCRKTFVSKDIVSACDEIYDAIYKISGESLQDDISMIGVERMI